MGLYVHTPTVLLVHELVNDLSCYFNLLFSCSRQAQDRTDDAGASSSSPPSAEDEERRRKEVEEKVRAAREAEEKLDAFAYSQVGGGNFKLVLLTGDVDKCLFGKKQFQKQFEVVSVGRGALHLLQNTRSLPSLCSTPGAVLVVESIRYMLETKKEQVPVFEERIAELAKETGWTRNTQLHDTMGGLTKAHLVFQQ